MTFVNLLFFLINIDFPISTAVNEQFEPAIAFANNQYYVFWVDYREQFTIRSIYGARVTTEGAVLDPEGKLIFMSRTEAVDVAYDGGNFLVALQDSC